MDCDFWEKVQWEAAGVGFWPAQLQLEKVFDILMFLFKVAACASVNTNVIPITVLYNMLTVTTLGVLRCQEGICGLKPAQACCSPQNSFANCSVLALYIGLSQVYTPPMLVWLIQRDSHTLLMKSRRNTHTTSWSTQLVDPTLWYEAALNIIHCNNKDL